jgi:hypothetical protein
MHTAWVAFAVAISPTRGTVGPNRDFGMLPIHRPVGAAVRNNAASCLSPAAGTSAWTSSGEQILRPEPQSSPSCGRPQSQRLVEI